VALDAGKIDAAAASNSLGLIWQPISRIVPTPVLYNPIELCFAASRKAPGGVALTASIDEAIHAQHETDPASLRNILERYAVPVREEYVTPAWVSIALAALVAILSAAIAILTRQAHALRSSARGLELAKEKLEITLEEKDLLVHELSHRVKNNLQIILSLVGLVEGENDNLGETALAELREKVYSISLIEEELHARGAIDEASLRSFFEAMTERLTLTCTGITSRFSLETDFHQAILVPSAAFPLALILSELAFNAIRHGRGSDGSVVASIRVHVHEDGSGEIVVSDCGTGFPPDFDVMRTPGLGYRLISALVSQLKGKLTTHTNSGATVRITIPRVGWTVSLS
jgi:two-component sensor histidine kinase